MCTIFVGEPLLQIQRRVVDLVIKDEIFIRFHNRFMKV